MIVGHQLHDWLTASDRQQRSLAAARSFASSWRAGPIYRRLADTIMEAGDGAEAVADAVRQIFADDRWIDELLAGLAAELAPDPFFDPPFTTISSEIHTGLLLFEDERVSIAAGVTRAAELAARKNVPRGATSIGFTGYFSVLKFVRSGEAFLSVWSAPAITDGFAASQAGRCVRTGGRRIADGETLVLDGRCQSFVIEHAGADMVVLQASIKSDQAPLSIEYDSASHGFVGATALDDGASRIQMLTTLLRRMDVSDAFPVIAGFLDDPDFFVRWHVMRELLGLDAEAALPHLRAMAEADPHSDVRDAAQAVLARFEQPDQTRRAAWRG